MRLIRLIPLAMLMFQSACTNGNGTNPCTVFHPIYPSSHDILTPDTQRQILKHDETGHSLCGWSLV